MLGCNDFMAEEINAGVAVFVADRGLSMCGLGSDGVAALLSAHAHLSVAAVISLSSRLEMLFQGLVVLLIVAFGEPEFGRVEHIFFSYLSESVYSLVNSFAGISLASSGLLVLMIFSTHSTCGVLWLILRGRVTALATITWQSPKIMSMLGVVCCYYMQTRHFGDKDGIH